MTPDEWLLQEYEHRYAFVEPSVGAVRPIMQFLPADTRGFSYIWKPGTPTIYDMYEEHQ